MNNPFNPKKVKMSNYNPQSYATRKLDNIIDNKTNAYNNMMNSDKKNQPFKPMTNEEKEQAMKDRVENLKEMRNYANRNNRSW